MFIAVYAGIFPIKRRQRSYFSGSTPLMPLFFRLNDVSADLFLVKRRWRRFFFRLKAVNAAIIPVQSH